MELTNLPFEAMKAPVAKGPRHVLLVMALYADEEGCTGISQEQLAFLTGYGFVSVNSFLKVLLQGGQIRAVRGARYQLRTWRVLPEVEIVAMNAPESPVQTVATAQAYENPIPRPERRTLEQTRAIPNLIAELNARESRAQGAAHGPLNALAPRTVPPRVAAGAALTPQQIVQSGAGVPAEGSVEVPREQWRAGRFPQERGENGQWVWPEAPWREGDQVYVSGPDVPRRYRGRVFDLAWPPEERYVRGRYAQGEYAAIPGGRNIRNWFQDSEIRLLDDEALERLAGFSCVLRDGEVTEPQITERQVRALVAYIDTMWELRVSNEAWQRRFGRRYSA